MKKEIIKILAAAAFAVLIISFSPKENVYAAKYYIATDGSDNSNGSKNAPYATFAHALENLKAGDTLYVRGGEYTEKICIPSGVSGEEKRKITISGYGNEDAVIDGDGKSVHLLEIDGASYINIQKLKFRNAVGNESAGICIYPSSKGIGIIKNEISDISISGEASEDNNANGIIVFGDSANTISDIEIKKNYIHDLQTGYSEALSVAGNCEDIRIRQNKVENITNIGIDCSGNYGYCPDSGLDSPRKLVIEKNTVRNCVSPYASSYGIYIDGAHDASIRKNLVENCSGGIEVGAEQSQSVRDYAAFEIKVEKNKIYDNTEAAISVGGYEKEIGRVGNVVIKKNLCRRNGDKEGCAMVILTKCDNIEFTGNRFFNDNGKGDVIYSEMPKDYTYDIKSSKNLYSNNDNDSFVINNVPAESLEGWKKKG